MKRPPIVSHLESPSAAARTEGRPLSRQRRIVRLVVGRRLALELTYLELKQAQGSQLA